MDKRIIYGLAAIVALFLVFGTVNAYSMMGRGFRGQNQDSRNFDMMNGGMMGSGRGMMQDSFGMVDRMMNGNMMQMHEEVEEALESKDYDAFIKIHEEYGMPMKINKENFEKMAEWHEAMEEGDYEKLVELRKEGFQSGVGTINGANMMGSGCTMMG